MKPFFKEANAIEKKKTTKWPLSHALKSHPIARKLNKIKKLFNLTNHFLTLFPKQLKNSVFLQANHSRNHKMCSQPWAICKFHGQMIKWFTVPATELL